MDFFSGENQDDSLFDNSVSFRGVPITTGPRKRKGRRSHQSHYSNHSRSPKKSQHSNHSPHSKTSQYSKHSPHSPSSKQSRVTGEERFSMHKHHSHTNKAFPEGRPDSNLHFQIAAKRIHDDREARESLEKTMRRIHEMQVKITALQEKR
jgi:hypothetical protein